jgi:hypothetical protein
MPEIITSNTPVEHLLMSIFDNDGNQLVAERVIDISDICDETTVGVGQTLIKYGRTERGLIAQVQDREQYGEDENGSIWHIFPDELGIAGMITADYFIHRARVLGCNVMQLAETIVVFSPPTEPSL